MKTLTRKPDCGYLARHLWVPKWFVDVKGTKSALTFRVVDYAGEMKVVELFSETDNHLLLPRAFWDPSNLPFPVVDLRPQSYEYVDFKHSIKLDHRPHQQPDGSFVLLPTGDDVQVKAAQAVTDSDGGILQLACGKGKTIVALYLIAQSKKPAIVIVDNTYLLEQWRKKAETLLEVPGGIGVVGAGKKDWEKNLVFATYQTLAQWAEKVPTEMRRRFHYAFWDEGHHVSAPVFALSVDMFYGKRVSLTATPKRSDGMHVIASLNIGDVVYKDLRPELPVRTAFYYTGEDAVGHEGEVVDKNGKVHRMKLATFYGKKPSRIKKVLDLVLGARRLGRRVLFLTDSKTELANLASVWSGFSTRAGLYSDLSPPDNIELGTTLTPQQLSAQDLKQVKAALKQHEKNKKKKSKQPYKEPPEAALQRQLLEQHQLAGKVERELKKKQLAYIEKLGKFIDTDAHGATSGGCGIITAAVPVEKRYKYIEEHQVNFAISKYGREGLDCAALDTIIVSTLFTEEGGIQQILGRVTRLYYENGGKKTPLVIFLVDKEALPFGMHHEVVRLLRNWPVDEGGPFHPLFCGFPGKTSCEIADMLKP